MHARTYAVLVGLLVFGWGGAAEAGSGCRQAFDELSARIETEYPGYVQAVAPAAERRAAYEAAKTSARRAAGRADQNDCTFVLRSFIAQFDDPHVFLLERPELAAEAAARYRARAERADFARLRPAPAGSALSGQWAAPEYDVLIARDGREDRFIAVV